MHNSKLTKNIGIVIIILIISVIYTFITTPTWYIQGGVSDKLFHLLRLVETSKNLSNGHLTYIMTTTFGANGQGINFFYPIAGLMPYLLPLLFVKNFIHAFFIGTFIRTFIGLLLSFWAMRILKRSNLTSLLFAISYVFSSYLLYDSVARFDLGETLANLAIPLVFAAFYLILIKKDTSINTIIILSFSLALTTYSHLMTTIITICLLILIFIIYNLINWESFTIFLSTVKSFIISAITYILMTLAFFIPLIDQITSVKIKNPQFNEPFGIPGLSTPSLSQILNVSISNQTITNNVTLGLMVVIGTLILLINFKYLTNSNKLIYITGVILTLISTDIFPWNLLKDTPIASIQMPSRFIPFASLLLIFVIIDTLMNTINTISLTKKNYFIIYFFVSILPIIFALGSTSTFFFNQKNVPISTSQDALTDTWGTRNIKENQWDVIQGSIYYDYLPKQNRNINNFIQGNKVKFNQKYINLSPINGKKPFANGIEFNINSSINQSGNLFLPFWIYNPSEYQVLVNNKSNNLINNNNNVAQINAKLHKGSNKIKIRFKIPIIYTVSNFISIIFILFSVLIIFNNNRSKK